MGLFKSRAVLSGIGRLPWGRSSKNREVLTMSLHESSTFNYNLSQPNPADHIPVENRGEPGRIAGEGVHTYIGFFEAEKYPEALALNRKELKRCWVIGKVDPRVHGQGG
jgi:hypothetical protein